MSLSTYHCLTQQFSQNELGVELPKLTAANLKVSSKKIPQAQLLDHITTFIKQASRVQAWVQYRDETVITASIPTRSDIIEAQYSDDKQNSLQIKLLTNNNYLVSAISLTDDNSPQSHEYVYSQQRLVIRNNLKESANLAYYRLWWQQATTEEQQQGRWQPVLQQFIGFDLSPQGEH